MADFTFKTPKLTVALGSTRRRRYEVLEGDEGWFFHDKMEELWESKQLQPSFFPKGTYLEFGDLDRTETIAINRKDIKGIILRPVIVGLTELQCQDSYYFDPGLAYWDFRRSEDGLFWEMTFPEMTDDEGDPVGSVVMYRGQEVEEEGYPGFCPNGFFAVGLRRQPPTEEMIEELEATEYSNANWTNIVWGNGTWCLHIPLKGRPTLFENVSTALPPPDEGFYWPDDWVEREWTDGQIKAMNPRSSGEEGASYKIGVIGHAICVTEGDFEDSFAYYLVTDRDQPIAPAGPVMIHNWPGQCTVWLAPLTFKDSSLLYRYPIYVGAYREEEVEAVVFGQPGDPLEGVSGMEADCYALEQAEYPGYMHYWVDLIRGEYPADPQEFDLPSYSTPLLEAVSIYQPADLTDNGEPTWETTNRPGYELTLDGELGSSSSSQLGLTMENRLQLEPPGGGGAVPTQEYGIGTTVKIGAGWVYKTLETPPGEIVLTANLGQYIIINAERDKRHGVFDLTDIYGILALAQWDQGKLNFKGWPVLDAQEYLLQMYGVGPDWYDLEDLGLSLDPGDDSWAYEGGKSITDILADLANRGNKASCLWYDWSVNKIRTGCKYCRTKRTAETWASHQDNGWNSSGCRAEDLARNPLGYDVAIVDERALATDPGSLDLSKTLSAKIAPLAQGQYANRISVYGKSPSGVEISARWVDERTLYAEGEPGNFYLGFPICKVERDDNLLTQDAVNAKLVELIHELAAWPQIVNWTMPFHFGLRPGYVARIEGAQYAACHEGLYRMLTVGHNVRQRETAVTARRMYPVEESEE